MQPLISPQTQRANERYLYVELAWISIAFAMEWYYLNVYAIHIGATPTHLGILASGRALLMVIGAGLTNRWQQRFQNAMAAIKLPNILFRTILYLSIVFVPFLPAAYQADAFVVLVLLSAIPTGIGQGVFLGMLPNAVGDRLAIVVSRRSIIMNGVVLIGLAFFGQLLERVQQPMNYQIGFAIAFVASFLGWRALFRIEVPDMPPRSTEHDNVNVWAFAPFRNFAIVVLMINMGVFMAAPLIPLQLVEGLKASDSWISFFGVFEMGAGALLMLVMDRLIKRFGTRRLIIATTAATISQVLILGITPTLPPYIIGELLHGAGWFAVNVLLYNRLVEIVPANHMRAYAATYQTIINAALFAGPLLGTVLIEGGMSVPGALLFCAGLRTLATILAWTIRVNSNQLQAQPLEAPRPVDA